MGAPGGISYPETFGQAIAEWSVPLAPGTAYARLSFWLRAEGSGASLAGLGVDGDRVPHAGWDLSPLGVAERTGGARAPAEWTRVELPIAACSGSTATIRFSIGSSHPGLAVDETWAIDGIELRTG